MNKGEHRGRQLGFMPCPGHALNARLAHGCIRLGAADDSNHFGRTSLFYEHGTPNTKSWRTVNAIQLCKQTTLLRRTVEGRERSWQFENGWVQGAQPAAQGQHLAINPAT